MSNVYVGINPVELRGSKTGVYLGVSLSEAHDAWSHDMEHIVGDELVVSRSLFPSRISYFFDFKVGVA